MAEVNLVVSADIQGIKTKLEELTSSVADIQSKIGTSMKSAADMSEKAMTEASNAITDVMVKNSSKVVTSEQKRVDLIKKEVADLSVLKAARDRATSVEQYKSLDGAIKNTEKTIKQLSQGMTQFRDITHMSLGEMRQYMKELRNTSLVGLTPQQIKQVNSEMAILTDAMQDYRGSLTATGDKTEMMISGMQGVVAAAQGVTSTLALFGVENKNLEKSMMALINLSQMMATIHQLNERGVIKGVAATVKDTASKYLNITALRAQAISQKAVNASTVAGATGFKVLGAAMKALPLVGIIAGLTAVVGAVVALVRASKDAKLAEEERQQVMEDVKVSAENYKTGIASQKEALEDLSKQYKKTHNDHMLAAGKITQVEHDRIENELEGIESVKSAEDAFIEASSSAIIEANKKKLLEEDRYQEELRKFDRQTMNSRDVGSRQYKEKQIEIEKVHAENIAAIESEKNSKLKESQKLYMSALDTMRQTVSEKNAESIRLEKERQNKAWQSYLNELKSVNNKIADMKLELIENDEEREQAKLELDRKREIEGINAKEISAAKKEEAITVINEVYAKRRDDITEKYIKIEEEKEKELYSYKLGILRENKKNADAYYDSLLANASNDEETTKMLLEKQKEANIEYYDGLIALEEEMAKADDIMTQSEIDNIERLKKAREEYIGEASEFAPPELTQQEPDDNNEEELWQKRIDIAKQMAGQLYNVYKDNIEKQIQIYDELISQREQKIDEIQSLLEAEIQLNKDGYASNIQMYETQLQQEQKLRDEALAQQEKYNKKKAIMESFEQSMDISSAIASILADAGVKFGVGAPVAAAIAITALLTLFKTMQSKGAVKFERGGRGIFEGASHENGGIKIGNNMEAQGGEAYYIFNKTATNSKGKLLMDTLFDAINGGRINFDSPMALSANAPLRVELKEQQEIKDIWKHIKGQREIIYGDGYRIETFGNVRRKIIN